MNQVALTPDQIALLQQGFYQVVHGGGRFNTGRQIGDGAALSISAKTGTAETYVSTPAGVQKAVNTNVVAYAPSQDPQIAVAVVLPNLTDLDSKTTKNIMREIINLYHSLHPSGE